MNFFYNFKLYFCSRYESAEPKLGSLVRFLIKVLLLSHRGSFEHFELKKKKKCNLCLNNIFFLTIHFLGAL